MQLAHPNRSAAEVMRYVLPVEQPLYEQRFSASDIRRMRRVWQPICRYLQRYVPAAGATLDIGAGHCHFINSIRSAIRIAVDVNRKALEQHAALGVVTLVGDGAELTSVADESIDAAFASNVYEHFVSREAVAKSFAEIHRVLKPGGVFIIVQPNFRYCMRRYFDFFDHRLAFTHDGLAEGLRMTGFSIERNVPRFLPYTSKTAAPQHPALVALYLRIPPLWRIFGAQMLLVARRP